MPDNDQSATLDPPGTIAVIGAGPLGIEAALYGRFLGYDVMLFDSVEPVNRLVCLRDEPLPLTPSRSSSPLARAAIESQEIEAHHTKHPTTIAEWIDQVWKPLLTTDLLRGRVRSPETVIRIELVDVSGEDDDIPPDFRLTTNEGTADFESVILASGTQSVEKPELTFATPCDYFHPLSAGESGDHETDFWQGLHGIVTIFAELGGRKELDLYRPARGD
ncbi:MAG: hypothetical protein AAF802_28065 [Planctomycetota bacterium]